MKAKARAADDPHWPALPYAAWRDTCQTLHLWTQIVGKVRLELAPYVNHWWQVPLYVSGRGLTTSPIPYANGIFEVAFDFIDHNLSITTSQGGTKYLPLLPRSVAIFYQEFMRALAALGIQVEINTMPSEIQNAIPCDEDHEHASYDPVYARRFWQILVQTETVLRGYRSRFIGKSSPIHFFWGSFDLALTFFSGRRAPERSDADAITKEAYSHEVISVGFWPGNDAFPEPAFYGYAAPTPAGLGDAHIHPAAAFYSQEMGEFLLKYGDIRTDPAPEQDIRAFFDGAYDAAATLGKWDRAALERSPTPSVDGAGSATISKGTHQHEQSHHRHR
jgi:hypothetical protein